MEKYVYLFKEGNKDLKNLLGGKGANLAEMTSLGLPVPQGFIITTEACNKYYENGKTINDDIISQIKEKLVELEEITSKKVGDKENPLLVSVRSGARVSMPGMMDTILNLGLNDEVAQHYAKKTNNKRFIYDSYRRLIQMYADVVMDVDKENFEEILRDYKAKANKKLDTQLDENELYEITLLFKEKYKEKLNEEFPQDPFVQMINAIKAVFRSWMNPRAIFYRKINEIDESWGTAVNIQEMVYGNLGETSGTGVAFTRNPANGENTLFGEYLFNAQGEDVVAGIRTPQPISKLKEDMPHVYEEFLKYCGILESHYKDMQDMEFTIENKKLFMLQTRNGKRTAQAALKIAYDLYEEKVISKEEAILRIEPNQLDQLLHPMFNEKELKNATVIASGLAASPGAATGQIYFTAQDVINAAKKGIDAILVRHETSPEDIEGMQSSKGILTLLGGMTSHAAVVARGMGICCVSGCEDLIIDMKKKTLSSKEFTFKEGDYISINGTTGQVYKDKIELVESEISGEFEQFMNWANEIKVLKIKANADNKTDAMQALKLGAEGIGLCRTEHMFFEKSRIFNFRKMILSQTKEQREEMLDVLLPYQQSDFEDLFEVMDGKSVTIRYLDPPLHEFLPNKENEIKELAQSLEIKEDLLKQKIDDLKEFNPMMGHRGVRLAVTYPEITVMQTKALISAAINVFKKGVVVKPQIMIPLIGDEKEFLYIKEFVTKTADELLEKENVKIDYEVGTMIEVPRAVLISDILANHAQFYSFGTNDLTQMTYGFSRDDAAKFLTDYYDKKIFEFDPFVKLDQVGVGSLLKETIKKSKTVRPDIELGICGEHGGEPTSVEFCHKIGLNYVSCSPFRIPIAKLAAAQAVLKEEK
ncbi:MAG: pyruvate, phosphate dikinase [Mycoplasmatota bacterium]